MRHTITRRLLLCGLLLTTLVSPAFSQGLRNRERRFRSAQQISSDIQGARFRWHQFYFLSRFELSDIGYNDEFYVPTAELSSGGLTFGISAPQKLYYIPSRKLILSVQATPTYNLIGITHEQNQWSYAYRGDAQVVSNFVYVDFYGEKTHSPRTDQLELNHIVTRDDGVVGFNGEYKYSSKTSVGFSGFHKTVSYPIDALQPPGVPVEVLDHDENNSRISFLHRTFQKTSLFASAEASNYAFSHSRVHNARRSLFAFGMDYINGGDRFRLEAGPGRLDLKDPTQRDFSGILGSLNAAHEFGAKTTLTGLFNRDVDFSIFANNNYYIVNRAGIELLYTASRKLTLRGGSDAAFTRYDASIFDGLDNTFKLRHDKIIFSSVGFLYRLGRKLRGGLDVGYYQRESNVDAVSQGGIRYVLHLSFTP